MQCPYKKYIYSIDKKAIKQDLQWLYQKGILKRDKIEKMGNGNPYWGIDIYFTGKEWVYYEKSPKFSKYAMHRKLFEMGYFKFSETGCQKCEICRIEKSKDWATKGYCEGETWKNKCFVTLTYNGENLPSDRKLRRSDIQKFWKDLRYHLYKKTKKTSKNKVDLELERNHMEEIYSNELEDVFGANSRRKNRYPVRYINCGEYGPKTKRPHYHAVIFNFKPFDMRRLMRDRRGYWVYTSNKLNKIWDKGYVIVEHANYTTCAYVARYTTKKYDRTPEEQEKMKAKKQIEFIGASSLGFIGYYYWLKNKEKIKENKGIFIHTKAGTHLQKIPKAMERKWKWENEDEYEEYEFEKERIGKENWEKILSGTELSENEYIWETYRARMEKYRALKRDAN